jgi:predicted ABC-type transport system involved in lysophospholipase L1 biosynthesis ATPase subunit
MSLLALEHVSRRCQDGRRQIAVLDDVSLELEEGEVLGVWGMRRSGKSTLLRVAAGRELPDDGSVYFDGVEITRMSADRRAKLQRHAGIGLLGADWRPARNNPVVEHVALPLLSDGMSLREAMEPAWLALESVGCAACAHMLADSLSNGERIRVALAQTLVREPRVLLVDEPAALMRPSEAVEFYKMLSSLGRTLKLALVIASEDIAPIRKATRMFSIDGGRLRAMEQPGTVVAFPERSMGRTRSQP